MEGPKEAKGESGPGALEDKDMGRHTNMQKLETWVTRQPLLRNISG